MPAVPEGESRRRHASAATVVRSPWGHNPGVMRVPSPHVGSWDRWFKAMCGGFSQLKHRLLLLHRWTLAWQRNGLVGGKEATRRWQIEAEARRPQKHLQNKVTASDVYEYLRVFLWMSIYVYTVFLKNSLREKNRIGEWFLYGHSACRDNIFQ
jgi:hypothetical protein